MLSHLIWEGLHFWSLGMVTRNLLSMFLDLTWIWLLSRWCLCRSITHTFCGMLSMSFLAFLIFYRILDVTCLKWFLDKDKKALLQSLLRWSWSLWIWINFAVLHINYFIFPFFFLSRYVMDAKGREKNWWQMSYHWKE